MSTSFVDRSLLGVAISLPIIASACVVLRLCANKRRGIGSVTGDDWTIFVTLVSYFTTASMLQKSYIPQLLCWGHSVNTIVAGCLGGVGTITMPPREYANMTLRV